MERRKEPRYPLTCHVDAASASNEECPRAVSANALNVSAGGACIVGELAPEPFSVLPCHFHFADVPVPIPLLMQVRWVEPVPSPEGAFRIGLSFLT
jgi:hypothetical protein